MKNAAADRRPPNRRIPPLTEETLVRRKGAVADFARFLNPKGPEDTGLTVRYISYGVPNLLTGYNSHFQIPQTPSHVVILQELISVPNFLNNRLLV